MPPSKSSSSPLGPTGAPINQLAAALGGPINARAATPAALASHVMMLTVIIVIIIMATEVALLPVAGCCCCCWRMQSTRRASVVAKPFVRAMHKRPATAAAQPLIVANFKFKHARLITVARRPTFTGARLAPADSRV